MMTDSSHVPSCPGDVTTSITLRNTAGEWAIAFAVCALITIFMMAYHDWWRAKPYSVGTLHESLGLAGLAGISLALALGPLSRLMGRLQRVLRARRALGLMATVFTAGHVVLSFWPLGTIYFTRTYFAEGPQVACLGLGIIAFALLVALAAVSRPAVFTQWGFPRWKRMQNLGYALLALVLLHFLALGKIAGWMAWFRLHDQPAPPGTFPLFILGVAVLILKGVDWLVFRRRRATDGKGKEA